MTNREYIIDLLNRKEKRAAGFLVSGDLSYDEDGEAYLVYMTPDGKAFDDRDDAAAHAQRWLDKDHEKILTKEERQEKERQEFREKVRSHKPAVPNKYGLTAEDLDHLQVLDKERLKEHAWWNDALKAWCITKETKDRESDFWIGFYEDGQTETRFTTYGGMCSYKFKEFYDVEEIENMIDWEIQEKALTTINGLLDKGIIGKEERKRIEG